MGSVVTTSVKSSVYVPPSATLLTLKVTLEAVRFSSTSTLRPPLWRKKQYIEASWLEASLLKLPLLRAALF